MTTTKDKKNVDTAFSEGTCKVRNESKRNQSKQNETKNRNETKQTKRSETNKKLNKTKNQL